ncbi:hypothetical protein ACTHTW_11140, partial [Neisseria sp. P0018.S006]
MCGGFAVWVLWCGGWLVLLFGVWWCGVFWVVWLVWCFVLLVGWGVLGWWGFVVWCLVFGVGWVFCVGGCVV